MDNTLTLWIAFNIFVLFLLALDLGVFNRKNHVIGVKEALSWSAFWIALSLVFGGGVYYFQGMQAGGDFMTAYLLEKSLSVDNLFVILLIFNYFKIPGLYQHKVLFWGILGALVMRGSFILVGAALIHRFEWILYLFGAFLIYTGIKMLFDDGEAEIDPDANPLVKTFKKFMPVTPNFHDSHFFVIEQGKRHATPLFIALLVVELSDLIFAVDSIPAVFAVTQDPFIVYTSNVLAILGLRSLYFALAAIIDTFHYLKYGLAVVLTLIGLKMLAKEFLHDVPSWVTLSMVLGALALSILASVIWPPKPEEHTVVEDAFLHEKEKDEVHG